MNKLKYIILGSILFCSVAATPLYSTKVNEALKLMLSSDGKFKEILYSDGTNQNTAGLPIAGGTVTGNLNVTGDLMQSGYRTPIILYNKYVDATMTGTTSTQLATFTLPGDMMGINGAMEVAAEYEFADTSGQKALSCYNGVVDIFGIGSVGTTTIGYSGWGMLINKGSTTSNAVRKIWRQAGPNSTVTSFITTGTVNTGTDTVWTVRANNVSPATGTITLHYLKVVVYPGD